MESVELCHNRVPGISFLAFGLVIHVQAIASVLEVFSRRIAASWTVGRYSALDRRYAIATELGQHTLYQGRSILARSEDLNAILPALESDLYAYLATRSGGKVFVHAGVVGWRGSAVVMVGTNFSGKSTLVAALAKAGADYYSDEFAVFDSDGLVHPFSVPVSLRGAGLPYPMRHSIESLGGRHGVTPLPVGLLLFCQYKPWAGWHQTEFPTADAVLLMLANTFSPMEERAAWALAVLHGVAACARALKVTRGEATDVVDIILGTRVNTSQSPLRDSSWPRTDSKHCQLIADA